MKFLKFYLLPLLSAFLLGGCVSDGLVGDHVGSYEDDSEWDGVPGISLNLPTFDHVVTRSGETTAYSQKETYVKTCYVVIFSSDGALKNLASISPDNIGQFVTDSENVNDYTKKEILLDLSVFEGIAVGDEIHVIANPVTYPSSSSGLTKDNILEKFLMNAEYASVDGPGLPMYGITKKEGARLEVNLKTAVAKIQVKLATSVGGEYGSAFVDSNAGNANKLNYNLYQWATTAYINGTTPDVMECNPSEFKDVIDTDIVIYQVGKSTNDHYTDAIYPYPFPFSERMISTESVGEATKLVDYQFDYRRGCILLANRVNSAYKYYRLDLYKDGKYLDIKANTHYVLTITAVHSDGYDSAAQALMHPPGNIEFNLESSSVQLVSNGQYALSIDENPIKTYIDFTRHPMSPTGQNENMDLTTLRRVSSEDAIIVPTHGTPFVMSIIASTTTNILSPTTDKIQLVRVDKDGVETNVANNTYNGVINEDPDNADGNEYHKFIIKFTGTVGATYNFRYTIEMENINYTSDAFLYLSNYMFNSHEIARTVNIGRDIPADVQWNLYGGATRTTTNTYSFAFKTYTLWGNSYPSDNSVPEYWVRYTHLGSDAKFIYANKDVIGAIPRFKDKVLEGIGHDTKITIKQARPLYVGKINGSHHIATNYDYLGALNSSGYYASGTANRVNVAAYFNTGNGWQLPNSNVTYNGTSSNSYTQNYAYSPATILLSDGTGYETNLSTLHSMYHYIYAATNNANLQYYYNLPRPATLGQPLVDDQYYYQFVSGNYYWSANYSGSHSHGSYSTVMRMDTGAYAGVTTTTNGYYGRGTRIINYSF